MFESGDSIRKLMLIQIGKSGDLEDNSEIIPVRMMFHS